MKTTSEEQQEAEAREDLYRFFSAVYLYPPTPDLLRQFSDAEILEELSSMFGENAVADLKAFAAKVPSTTTWRTSDRST